MATYTSWIATALKKHYPKADFSKGVDLNRNGRLEANERITDANRNGKKGDSADWIAFYRRNAGLLQKLAGPLKWSAGLKPDHMLHEFLTIEADTFKSGPERQKKVREIKFAYAHIKRAVRIARQRLSRGKYGPADKAMIIHSSLEALGLTGISIVNKSVLVQMAARTVGSAGTNILVQAVAHELGISSRLACLGPNVLSVFSNGRGQYFSIGNQQTIPLQKALVSQLGNSASLKVTGQCTGMLTMNRVQAQMLLRRGQMRATSGDIPRAVQDLQSAYVLDPKNVQNLTTLAAAYVHLGRHRKAMALLGDVLKRAPQFYIARYQRAILYRRKKQHQRAIDDLSFILKTLKTDTDVYQLRGEIYLDIDKYDLARKDLTKSIEIKPTVKAFFNRGIVNRLLENYRDALRDLNIANSMQPNNVRILLQRGVTLVMLGRYRQSFSDLNFAISRSPKLFFAYLHRSVAHQMAGNIKAAVKDADTAVRLAPRNGMTYARRGVLYFITRKYKKVVPDLMRAIKYGYKSSELYAVIGLAKHWLGDATGARKAARDALALNAKEPKAYALLAIVEHKAGNEAKAFQFLNKAISFNPREDNVYAIRGEYLAIKGKHRAAIRDFSAALKINPKRGSAYLHRALSHVALKRYHVAICDFDRAIKLDSGVARVYYERGRAKFKLRLYDEAAADFSRAIKLKGKYHQAYNARGKALAILGKYHEALKDFDKAIALVRNAKTKARYHYNRAVVGAKAGQAARAQYDFARAISLSKQHPRARRKLSRLRAIPRISVGLKSRFATLDDVQSDLHAELGLQWNLINLYQSGNLGLGMRVGYGVSTTHHALDVSGAVTFTNDFKRSRFMLEAGAGYSAVTGREPGRAPLRTGGFYRYGASYVVNVADGVDLGARISIQHEMKDPKRFTIVPGIEMTFNLW